MSAYAIGNTAGIITAKDRRDDLRINALIALANAPRGSRGPQWARVRLGLCPGGFPQPFTITLMRNPAAAVHRRRRRI